MKSKKLRKDEETIKRRLEDIHNVLWSVASRKVERNDKDTRYERTNREHSRMMRDAKKTLRDEYGLSSSSASSSASASASD